MISVIIFVTQGGLRRHDTPAAYSTHEALHNRFVRWSRMGVTDLPVPARA